MRLPFGLVEVAGSSMAPRLVAGDVIVVRWGARPRVGDVVVGSFDGRADVLVVKRVARIDSAGVWLTGDNAAASDDSRTRGPVPRAAVRGRLVCRWRQPRASSA